MKKNIITLIVCLLLSGITASAEDASINLRMTLKDAIHLAHEQSVDAAVALNELKTAYWKYHTHRAEQLPEINFKGTLPAYGKSYNKYLQQDGTYTYLMMNDLGLTGSLNMTQNIALTGGTVSLNTSLDFTRQLGDHAYNEFMSVPIGITLNQPIFAVNNHKWRRRIEPIRYAEAKAAYIESVEDVTITAISYFFNLVLAESNKQIAEQNYTNAAKIYEIAVAKRGIGYISESELLQLNLTSLQAKAELTEVQSNLNSAMFQLRAFLGLSESDNIELIIPEDVPEVIIEYKEVLEKAQENNSFAKNIMRRQLEADYAVATAKGNRRAIMLFASLGYTGQDQTLKRTYNNLVGNQIVEVGVSIPLVDWGKRKGQVKVAESNRNEIQSRTRQEQMNFSQNIFLLVENFNNQSAQLGIAEEADRIADRRYTASIETFMLGKINVLDLNDARNSKDEARRKRIEEQHLFWHYFYRIRSLTLYDFIKDNTLDADFEELVRK